MKKIIVSCLAFLAVMCMITACGNVSEPSNVESSDKTIVHETTEYLQAEFEYTATLIEYIDAVNTGNTEQIVKYMFPDSLAETMLKSIDFSPEEYGCLPSGKDFTVVDINENDDFTDEYAEDLSSMYSQIKVMYDYLNENGEEAIFSYEPDDKEEELYSFIELYDVTITLADNNNDTIDLELFVYNVEGEGWNFDSALKDYYTESKNMSINSSALSLKKAVNTVLTDWDVNGKYVLGNYVICSDSSKNFVDNFEYGKFIADLENWHTECNELDYVLVISKGICIGVFCTDKAEPECVGMWPEKTIPVYENGTFKKGENELKNAASYSLDELYNMVVSQLD